MSLKISLERILNSTYNDSYVVNMEDYSAEILYLDIADMLNLNLPNNFLFSGVE